MAQITRLTEQNRIERGARDRCRGGWRHDLRSGRWTVWLPSPIDTGRRRDPIRRLV